MDIMTHANNNNNNNNNNNKFNNNNNNAKFQFNRLMLTLIFGIRASEPSSGLANDWKGRA